MEEQRLMVHGLKGGDHGEWEVIHKGDPIPNIGEDVILFPSSENRISCDGNAGDCARMTVDGSCQAFMLVRKWQGGINIILSKCHQLNKAQMVLHTQGVSPLVKSQILTGALEGKKPTEIRNQMLRTTPNKGDPAFYPSISHV